MKMITLMLMAILLLMPLISAQESTPQNFIGWIFNPIINLWEYWFGGAVTQINIINPILSLMMGGENPNVRHISPFEDVYQNPDGSYTNTYYFAPVNMLDENNTYQPFKDLVKVNIQGCNIVINYDKYEIRFQPYFIMNDGSVYPCSSIPSSVNVNLWKNDYPHYTKYGVDFSNVSTNIKNNLKYVVLHLSDSSNLTWDDISKEGNSLIIKNKIKFSHNDLLKNYTLPVVNKTDIVIGNLTSNFISNGDGTWNITFDPTITYNYSATYQSINSFAYSCDDSGTSIPPSNTLKACSGTLTDISNDVGLDAFDGSSTGTSQAGAGGNDVYQLFEFNTSIIKTQITSINFSWAGEHSGDEDGNIYVYFYNYSNNAWLLYSNLGDLRPPATIHYQPTTNINNHVNASSYMDFLVYWDSNLSGETLRSDYASLEVTYVNNPSINIFSPINAAYSMINPLFNITSSETGIGMIAINLDNSLISWWRMDDVNSTGTKVIDYMGRNNGTALSGAVQTDVGKFGKGFSFDGVNDYVDAGSPINITNNLTISSWVYVKGNSVSTVNTSGIVSNTNGNGQGYELRIGANAKNDTRNNVTFVFNSGGNWRTLIGNQISINTWAYVVVTKDSSNGTKIYINGNLDSSNSSLTQSIIASSTNIKIGHAYVGTDRYFNGTIDDVMIFNRSLTPNEIQGLYNATVLSHNNISLADGSHTLTAYVQDVLGNINFSSVNFSIDLRNLTACGNLTLSNSRYFLSQNVNSSGTCFTALANNVTLDCMGYTINYSKTGQGYAFDSAGRINTSIINCNIVKGSTTASSSAIYFRGRINYGRIINNTINTGSTLSSYGIYLLSNNNTLIANNTLITSSFSSDNMVISTSSFNTIINNSFYTTGGSSTNIYISGINSGGNNITLNRATSTSFNSLYSSSGGTFHTRNLIYNNIFNGSTIPANLNSQTRNDLNITNTSGANIVANNIIGGNAWYNKLKTGYSQTCGDIDRDGICDIPYVISGGNNNTDYLPLGFNDTVNPQISIISPNNNSYVNGIVTISAEATDNREVKNVTMWYKNTTLSWTFICSDTNYPYSCDWDVELLGTGDNFTINATVWDTSNNYNVTINSYTIDHTIPIIQDLFYIYPAGQTSVRNSQNISLKANVTDGSGSAGINSTGVFTDLVLINGSRNTTMILETGSPSSGEYSLWNVTPTLLNSVTDLTAQIPIYAFDNSTPLNNKNIGQNFIVVIDNSAPTWDNLYAPTNPDNNTVVTFSVIAYDNYQLKSYILSTNMTGSWVNETSTGISGISYAINFDKIVYTGNWSYRFYIFDDAGNMNATSLGYIQVLGNAQFFTINTYYPINNFISNTKTIDFNYSYTGLADNCSLYIDIGTGMKINKTQVNPTNNTNLNLTSVIGDGANIQWLIRCTENTTLTDYDGDPMTLTVDSTPPYFLANSPYNLSIYDNQSAIEQINASDNIGLDCFAVNNTINFNINCSGYFQNITILSVGLYYLNITINDTANNLNSSVILVNVSASADTTSPYFISIPNGISQSYPNNFNVSFNATDETAFGYYSINWTDTFVINQSGYLNNTRKLGVGNYYINITINDTSNNLNSTIFNINITQNNTYVLTITGTTPIIYPTATDITGSGCPNELSCSLDKSNGVYGVGESPIMFNYSTTGNTNYSSNSANKSIIINQNSTYVLSLVITPSNSVTVLTETTATGSNCPSELTCNLYRNDTGAVSNPDIQTLMIGYYNYTFNTSGNTNYSSNSISDILIVSKVPTLFKWSSLNNKTCYIEQSCSHQIIAIGEGTINYTLNDTSVFNITYNTGEITNISDLSSKIKYWFNATATNSSNYKLGGIFYIDIQIAPVTAGVSTPICLYKKLGYYNLNLPWIRQENCI